jgi:hypothetical protein
MELAFRIFLTLFFTTTWLIALNWVWTKQLDPRATLARAFGSLIGPPEWVATRDPNQIYQDGRAVGEVTGRVQERGSQIWFAQLANTTGFDAGKPFEYRRLTLRIVRVATMTGMKVEMTQSGSRTLTGVFEDVLCDVLR